MTIAPIKKRSISVFILLIAAVMSLSAVIFYQSSRYHIASAADARQFNANNIIGQGIFTNNNSMSAGDIQNFLNGQNSTCLKDYRGLALIDANNNGQVEDWLAAEKYGGPSGTQQMSAAELLKAAGDIYGINPQVLIVTLQKEQGLITRSDCPQWRYNTAFGFGCPDTAPCDSAAYGFTRQLDNAAYHFKNYMTGRDVLGNPVYSTFKTGPHNVALHPGPFDNQNNRYFGRFGDRRDVEYCGRVSTTIENLATASLYTYTPYRPNQAALNAQYGLGDTCSSYGNRNFFLYFNDWFGPTQPPAFSAQPTWQQVYTDATKSTALGWNASLTAGQSAYVSVVMKNTGNTAWTKSGAFTVTDTRLATHGPWGRSSAFCDPSWVISCTRPATLKENSVAPGESGTFEFPIRAPLTPGTYSESFSPIIDGRTVFSSGVMTFTFTVTPAIFSAQPTWQQVYTDATKATSLGWNTDLPAGQTAYASVVMKNTGNTTWTKSGAFGLNDVRLVSHGPWGKNSALCAPGWVIGCTRPATLKENSVAPGESGTFEFPIRAPLTPGKYNESFSLVIDGRTVFSSGVMTFSMNVTPVTFSAQPTWQQVYTDATKSTALGWNASLTAGQSAYVSVVMKNTGNTAWTKSGAFTVTDTRLATHGPWGRSSAFCDPSWVISCTRPATLKENSVAPGESGTFEFPIRAPLTPGTYSESFSPIIDGRTVFSSGVMTFRLVVQ